MTATLTVGAAVTRADVPLLCADLAALLTGRGRTEVVVDVAAVTRPDVVVVELLTRLALTARRHGSRLTVTGAHPELRDLLTLLGLDAVVPDA